MNVVQIFIKQRKKEEELKKEGSWESEIKKIKKNTN